jgi:hypothetical protein
MVLALVTEAGGGSYVVMVRKDTWSRAARRKKTQQLRALRTGPQHCNGTRNRDRSRWGERAALVAHVWVEEQCVVAKSGSESGVQLVVQWKRGHEATSLLSSFS